MRRPTGAAAAVVAAAMAAAPRSTAAVAAAAAASWVAAVVLPPACWLAEARPSAQTRRPRPGAGGGLVVSASLWAPTMGCGAATQSSSSQPMRLAACGRGGGGQPGWRRARVAQSPAGQPACAHKRRVVTLGPRWAV